jgi:hypothetical protein
MKIIDNYQLSVFSNPLVPIVDRNEGNNMLCLNPGGGLPGVSPGARGKYAFAG